VTDYGTLLRLLADAGVRFIIVGGAAGTSTWCTSAAARTWTG
jgi:hypothetical protein